MSHRYRAERSAALGRRKGVRGTRRGSDGAGARRCQLHRPARRCLRRDRSIRRRKVDADPADQRAGAGDGGAHHSRRPGDHGAIGAWPHRAAAQDRHDLPALQSAFLAHGLRQCCPAARDRRAQQSPDREPGPPAARAGRALRQAGSLSRRAFRRAEAARRHRPGVGHRTHGPALRRGDVGARSGDDGVDPGAPGRRQSQPRGDHRAHHARDPRHPGDLQSRRGVGGRPDRRAGTPCWTCS